VGVDPEAALAAALGPRTRVLSVSWVRFQDGLVLNLERLGKECRRRGVLLVVDGIQGAGTLPIELDRLPGVAAFASGGHKGLLAPQGLGVLWTTPELRAQLTPPGGWLSVAGATDFSRPSTDLERSWLADGSKLETGVPNLLGCASLEESLRLLNRPDRGVLARHVAGLQWLLLEKLGGSKLWGAEAERLLALLMAGRIGSILSFHHRGQGPEALQKLLEEGIQRRIYASVREGYLRIALHGFHEPEDVERILDWMEER
jgi:selenocysteine lyase/cysteine desulfurase